MTELERIAAIIAEVRFPGYTFLVASAGDMGGALIRVSYNEPDVMTGIPETQHGRWWVVNHGWEPGQVVQTCFKALLTSLEHRAREHFTWRGRAVLQPHFALEQLWDLAAQREHEASAIEFTPEARS